MTFQTIRILVVIGFGATCFLSGCAKEPSADKPIVEGRIVDTEGRPIGGVVVHAARIRAVGGTMHNSRKWTKILQHDRFITDADGRYSGQLSYRDEPRGTWAAEYVFYYACLNGYHPLQLYLPKRGTLTMRRVEQPSVDQGTREFAEAFSVAGCE
jgi:hypothetical protein